VIAKPDWSAAIGDADATGGPAVDLHIHDTHFVGLIAGVPKAVSSVGRLNVDYQEAGFAHGWIEKASVDYLTTNYLYDSGGPALSCSCGAVATKGRQFVHGFELYFEKATLSYSSGGTPLTVFHADGTSEQPKLGDGDPIAAFTTEIQTAVDAVKSGDMPALLSGQLARDALVLCFREIESVKSGKVVAV
jgi:predicted dehydrogenase